MEPTPPPEPELDVSLGPNQRALLEAPEFATDLYRNEIGSVGILWDREVAGDFTTSRTREIVSLHIVPYAVNTCLGMASSLPLSDTRWRAPNLSPDCLRSAIRLRTLARRRLADISASPRHQNGLSDQRKTLTAMHCQLIGSCQNTGTMNPPAVSTNRQTERVRRIEMPEADHSQRTGQRELSTQAGPFFGTC